MKSRRFPLILTHETASANSLKSPKMISANPISQIHFMGLLARPRRSSNENLLVAITQNRAELCLLSSSRRQQEQERKTQRAGNGLSLSQALTLPAMQEEEPGREGMRRLDRGRDETVSRRRWRAWGDGRCKRSGGGTEARTRSRDRKEVRTSGKLCLGINQ